MSGEEMEWEVGQSGQGRGGSGKRVRVERGGSGKGREWGVGRGEGVGFGWDWRGEGVEEGEDFNDKLRADLAELGSHPKKKSASVWFFSISPWTPPPLFLESFEELFSKPDFIRTKVPQSVWTLVIPPNFT